MMKWIRENWQIITGLATLVGMVIGVAGQQAVQANTILSNSSDIKALKATSNDTAINITIICTILADMTDKPVRCIYPR